MWKTTNGGVSWDPVFDSAGVAAIGDIAIAPSDSQTVWVGTGDQANARSSYSGRGLFKTIDGGATWQAIGLPDSHHIARIVIDPVDLNRVYVAVMGHLFSRNEERGVFRTTDGGRTWSKMLYLDDRTGAIDLVIDRRSPSVLYAVMYDKERMPWRLIESGPGTGIYKSVDGGDSWKKLGGGLPTGQLGRIGLDIFQKNPNILYALIENQNAPATPAANAAVRPPGQPRRQPLDCRKRALELRRRNYRRGPQRSRRRQGAIFVQSTSDRSRQRSARHRYQRQHDGYRRRR